MPLQSTDQLPLVRWLAWRSQWKKILARFWIANVFGGVVTFEKESYDEDDISSEEYYACHNTWAIPEIPVKGPLSLIFIVVYSLRPPLVKTFLLTLLLREQHCPMQFCTPARTVMAREISISASFIALGPSTRAECVTEIKTATKHAMKVKV